MDTPAPAVRYEEAQRLGACRVGTLGIEAKAWDPRNSDEAGFLSEEPSTFIRQFVLTALVCVRMPKIRRGSRRRVA